MGERREMGGGKFDRPQPYNEEEKGKFLDIQKSLERINNIVANFNSERARGGSQDPHDRVNLHCKGETYHFNDAAKEAYVELQTAMKMADDLQTERWPEIKKAITDIGQIATTDFGRQPVQLRNEILQDLERKTDEEVEKRKEIK